jgi:hypothetical protein
MIGIIIWHISSYGSLVFTLQNSVDEYCVFVVLLRFRDECSVADSHENKISVMIPSLIH